MTGGHLGFFFCALAPFALLGLLLMVEVRVELAQRCARELAQWRSAPGRRWERSTWRTAGLAASNIVIPLLASFFGMAALTSHVDWLVFVSLGLHGLNVAQAVLGLWLMAQLFRRHKPGYGLPYGR